MRFVPSVAARQSSPPNRLTDLPALRGTVHVWASEAESPHEESIVNVSASPFAHEATDYYTRLLRPVFAGRKFLLTGRIAVLLGNLSRMLTGLGADRPFLLAGYEGTGSIPGPEDGELRLLGVEGTDILAEERDYQRTLDKLSPELKRDIDSWDPDGTARCIHTSALAVSRPVADRQSYGARPAAWAELEDKVRIDTFWDAVGVRRAPSRIVAADYGVVRAAADALSSSNGTVWAADAREGLNGGGLGLRWVRPGDDGRDSFAFLSGIANRVRVMPFIEGIPVSIHGIVFPQTVAVFRPVEMIVLRPSTGDRLFYAGFATAFDPHPDDREAMRRLAYRVGSALRETVGYRGPFGIDGVLAKEGFLPTEMNTRAGALLGPLANGSPELPLEPLCLAITEGERLDYRPDLLERAIVESADKHRTCAGWSVTRTRIVDDGSFDVVRDGDNYREARAGEEPHGAFRFGPTPAGGFVRFSLQKERVEPGPSAAPEVVRAFRIADRVLGTDFGDLETAAIARPLEGRHSIASP